MRKLLPSATTRRILANISWASLDKIIRLAGGLLVGTAVARYLGASSFGIYSYSYAIYAICNIVSNLGLDLLVIKEITLIPALEDVTLGTAFALKVGASVITTAVAILVAAILKPHDPLIIGITALLSIASILQGFEVAGFYFQAKLKSRVTILPTATVFLVACGLRVIAILGHATLIAFAWIAALEIACTQLCLGICFAVHRGRVPRWHFDLVQAPSLLKGGWPLMLSAFLIVFYTRCDQIILGMFCSSATVGTYSAAVRLAEVWYSLPVIVCGSVMPQLLKLKESNWGNYTARLQRTYDLMALASLVVGILTMLLGKWVIATAFGSQYVSAYPVLCIYIWSGLFVFVGIVGSQQMIYDGLSTLQLTRSLFGVALNVLLNFLLVPRFGATGSAVATLIVQAVVSYGVDLGSTKTRLMFRFKTRAYLFFWLFNRNLLKRSLLSGSVSG